MFAKAVSTLSLCPLVAERLLSGAQAQTAVHAAFSWQLASPASTSLLAGYSCLSNGVHLTQRMFASSPASGSSSKMQQAATALLSEALVVDESAVVVSAVQLDMTGFGCCLTRSYVAVLPKKSEELCVHSCACSA